jgi:alkylation response protein AidB-like acyl-CoA dehydrogenase
MAIRTRADLTPDGKHYILNGQKMWITNGGIADLFTVFAKVGGEKFTAFLVERSSPGVTPGAEEHKMGLHGSSTTALYFDNVSVPVENVLGEVGRGHIIAFNVLNIGRLKIGPYAVGASKEVLVLSLAYARERKAFGKTISEFGAIQHKLAEMAVRIFAVESMYWRVVGQIQQASAIKDLALECSVVKVYASETVGYVVDEGVQIHGGYGYHQDYAVERFYRDARIFRIFEGTNEINRVLIARAHPGFDKQQDAEMALADITIQTFALESVALRAQKLGAHAQDMCALVRHQAEERIESATREIFAARGLEPPVRPPATPVDTIALRRKIARRLLDAGRYVV